MLLGGPAMLAHERRAAAAGGRWLQQGWPSVGAGCWARRRAVAKSPQPSSRLPDNADPLRVAAGPRAE